MSVFKVSFDSVEWNEIRKLAKAKGMRPGEYIQRALIKYVERLRHDEVE